jgi:hypothetical protein
LKLLIGLILIAAALKVSGLIVHDQSANPHTPDRRRAPHRQTIITSDHARLRGGRRLNLAESRTCYEILIPSVRRADASSHSRNDTGNQVHIAKNRIEDNVREATKPPLDD